MDGERIEPGSSSAPESTFEPATAQDAPLEVQLLCECGQRDCGETVSLTLAAVEALRRTHRAILAPGHQLTPVRENLRSAAETREHARALRGESGQLRRRARLGEVGRVLVVDDSETFRRTAASIVRAASEVRLAGVAASGEEALRLLPDLRPDVVLLDVMMPGLDGVETARLIQEQNPKTLIVLVSAEPESLGDAASAVDGAAFLGKRDLRPETLTAVWLKHRTRD